MQIRPIGVPALLQRAAAGRLRPFSCPVQECSEPVPSIMDGISRRFAVDNHHFNTQKLALTALFVAISVVGSLVSFPVLGSRCAPIQHLVNVMCAVLLGPWWALGAAFVSSFLRNILGLGTLMAFPGSMCGALLSGLLYQHFKKLPFAYIGEVFGTGIIGGLLAYPVGRFLMGKEAAMFGYVIPFLISTCVGTLIAAYITLTLNHHGTLGKMKAQLNS